MKLGYWGARADSRGLAYQSQGFCKWLDPARILGVDMTTDDLSPYPCDWSPFAQPLTVVRPREITEDFTKEWMRGLDVILAAETFYKEEVIDWARELGITTVLQLNPEFAGWWTPPPQLPRHTTYPVPHEAKPDVLINPTTWLLDKMPEVFHLPLPVDRELFPFRLRTKADHFVHVAGHRAMQDRAGTRLVLGMLPRKRDRTWTLTVRSQSEIGFNLRRMQGATIEIANVADPRDLYRDADVLVLPRRYGGQNLIVNEALSCGIPVVMMDREPERHWGGVVKVPARRRGTIRTKAGPIELWDSSPIHLLQRLDELHGNSAYVEDLSRQADAHAQSMSWDTLLPVWMDVLEGASRGKNSDELRRRASAFLGPCPADSPSPTS